MHIIQLQVWHKSGMEPEVKVAFSWLMTTTQEMYAYAYDNGKQKGIWRLQSTVTQRLLT